MATLTGSTIASRYKSLLKVTGSSNDVLSANDLKIIEDGDGNNSAIQLAKNRIEIIPALANHAKAFEVSQQDGTQIFNIASDTPALTINAATVTLAQDTDFVTSGAINGMSIDGTTFSVDGSNNRVGIGTATPYNQLEILGTTLPQVRLTYENNTDYATFSVDGDGQLDITTVDGGGANGHICLMPDGNVGIGTVASASAAFPVSILEIRDGDGTGGAILTLSTKETAVDADDVLGRINFQAPLEASVTDAILPGASIHALAHDTFAANNNETSLVFSTASSDAEYGTATNGALFERMRISSDGSVGIGTAAPVNPLDIWGTGNGTDTGLVLRVQTTDSREYVIGHSTGEYGYAPLQLSNNIATEADNHCVGIGFAVDTDATHSSRGYFGMINPDEDSNDSRFVWKLKDSSAQVVERMTLSGAGNMRLMGDLYIDNPHPAIIFYEHDTTDHWWRLVADAGYIRLDYDSGLNGNFSPYATGWVQTPNGYIGLGTTAPASVLHAFTSSGPLAIKVQSDTIADTAACAFISQGKKSGGGYRYAQIGVTYQASGETDEACGYIRLDQTDGGILHLWTQNDNDLQASTNADDIGTTNGTAVGAQTSDERLKNISSDAFPYGLDKVNQLTPIKFTYKADSANISKLGFGAQTTQSIIPECVYNSKECPDGYTRDLYTADDSEVVSGDKQVGDEKGTDTPNSSETDKLYMKYVEIVPVLVKAIQELSAKVTALENA